MKIIKPRHLGLLPRPFRWQRQHYLGVAVMAMINMDALPRLLTEQALWNLLPEALQSPDGVLDHGLPKPHPEFLASGFAFPPGGAASHCIARIQVADREKTLHVYGDRQRREDGLSAPQPFTQMPLDWQHALGDAGDSENPLGKAIPNVEAAAPLLIQPGAGALPASFNAVPLSAPRRLRHVGSAFDEAWLAHDYPGFARDADRRLFNQGDADQRWDDRDALPAGAAWRIENMHPDKPLLEGCLPPWQARCFVVRQHTHGEMFEAIPLRATTLHFFPHLERIVMIWHGELAIREDDAADVLTTVAALESIHQPRTREAYEEITRQRSDPERSVLLALRDGELLPPGSAITDDEPELPPGPTDRNLARWETAQRQQLRHAHSDSGMDIDALAPTRQHAPTVPLEDLHDYIDAQDRAAQQQLAQMITRYQQEEALAPPAARPAAAIETYRSQRAAFDENAQQQPMDDRQRTFSSQALRDSYRFNAHQLSAPERLTPAQSAQLRQAVLVRDGDCREMDLTGADLSGLDLRDTDFSGALLENVDFSHCQLDGSLFSNAVLTRAELHRCSARACAFDNASLALAQCCYADFSDSVFSETECRDLMLEQCVFDRATLSDVMLTQTSLAHCRFHHAQIVNAHFSELTLQALDFSHATLRKVYFVECHLLALSFEQARLTAVGFVDCQAPEICFHQAQLHTSLFVADTALIRADFSGATLTQCNLRETRLAQANFSHAMLINSDLSGADCTQADMRRMQARECQFTRADLTRATLAESDLIGASFSKSQLQGCDFSGCNLFRADLSLSARDATTRFEEAWLNGMKTAPQRDEEHS
ncbi:MULTISPECIES: DUF2169 family type VI secretion system accessory protein [Pantoea]|uniref:DUF2169 family type VI secretion system accessory protein n=1 Tax=Pantoea TaxID=53335 RepID=UPI000EA2105C|nr:MULTISPECIES: DUF2169 domain-containing protein [Pantoea]NYB02641.1 DUF2169 domain-containing protein [Pantoea piersonii]NYB07384.1 DUF2169 domain-containing protein [Pantoea piersonii]NYB35191.1 DUF2169 domain-containing protein [Pantoea piersonii]RKJ85150.1 DUF2169 domain-containing protein [Pantoea piersonii]